MSRGLGKTQKRILLILKGGVALSFAVTPGQQLRTLRGLRKEWEKINRGELSRAIKALYTSHLVKFEEQGGGRVRITVTKEGKDKILDYNIDSISIKKPERWDGKWRIVSFDIPKDEKKSREVFRHHLRRLGFYMLQKSVFIFPHPCEDEIDFLVECYGLQRYIRRITASDVDNSLHLKQIFHLL